MEIKVFNYIEKLDCFVVDTEFKAICDLLGLRGWEQTAWVGRYFALDNDYGEHWFDNWNLRDEREAKARDLGVEYDNMLIIDPQRLRNGYDGPCHSDVDIKRFWTSVLRSLTMNLNIIIGEARLNNKQLREANLVDNENFIPDLETRIEEISKKYGIDINA
jgi:hypothetical protein